MVGDLTAILTTFKVGEREKKELLGALGPMKRDIAEKPTAASPAMDMKSVHEASAADGNVRASVAR